MGVEKTNFYHDEPLFGLDIGHSSIKVMQLEIAAGAKPRMLGYGVSLEYPGDTIVEGVIVKKNQLGKALYDLFKKGLVGTISTNRVACTIPTSHTFSRPMKLPPMESDAIYEAVHLEVEQYVPMPVESLYIDYEISKNTSEGVELLMVATPKKIIDSYVNFLEMMGLQPVALEPTMNAATRLFGVADASHSAPTILIDFGSVAIDIAVFDKTMFVNSTVSGGSDILNNLIAKRLGISSGEAYALKSLYGIGVSEKRDELMAVTQPMLDDLVREVRKTMRYYDERSAQAHRKIAQIVVLGGGANMPGLSEYLSKELSLPARVLDPWQTLDFGGLEAPDVIRQAIYLTVAGEALLTPGEIFV